MMIPLSRPVRLAVILLAAAALPLAAQEGEKAAGPPVSLEAVLVTPADPGPDTLCRLSVVLKNQADRSLSSFGFKVSVNGTDLHVYENQRYLEVLKPGETRTLELYNFWSSETHRPPKKDGSLQVEVSLVEARWVTMAMEDKVPTWTLLEPVTQLPPAVTVARPFKAPAKAAS
jgi:hypothetical protein